MQRPAEELRLENIVGALSLAMVDKMEQAYAAETGRGPSAVAAITQIGLEPGLSIERLRRIIALSHSAAVRLIDQLAAEGLVRREASGGSDKRARALTLTAAGEKLFKSALAARRGITQAALARLSAGRAAPAGGHRRKDVSGAGRGRVTIPTSSAGCATPRSVRWNAVRCRSTMCR